MSIQIRISQLVEFALFGVSIICVVLTLRDLLTVSFLYMIAYCVWMAISIAVVAFARRLAGGGTPETISVLLVLGFVFTMFLMITVKGGPVEGRSLPQRFAITFLNLPICWSIGRAIRSRMDVIYRRQGQKTAEEINQILDHKIRIKTQIQSQLAEYAGENRNTSGFLTLFKYVCEDGSGDRLCELYENEENKQDEAFMKSLAELAREDTDYDDKDFAGWNVEAMLKRVTNDIARCDKGKIDLLTVTSDDCQMLLHRLKELRNIPM